MIELPRVNIDFGNIEKTIKSFDETDQLLLAMLSDKNNELIKKQVEANSISGSAEMALRNSGAKITEGYVKAALTVDEKVNKAMLSADTLANDVSTIKNAIAALDRAFSLFKAWLKGHYNLGASAD